MIKIKIILGCDHQGIRYKEEIIKKLKNNEIAVEYSSVNNNEEDDYPDFAIDVCKKVLEENALGILICGSGIGMSIAANKIKGIRCARVVDENDAFSAKNHNGANVIAFGINVDLEEVYRIIDTFIGTKSPSEARHLRRIEKINKLEEGK